MLGRFNILRGDARWLEHDGRRRGSIKGIRRTIIEVLQNLDSEQFLRHFVAVFIHFNRIEDGTQFSFGFDIV